MKINPQVKHLLSRAGFGINAKEAIQYQPASLENVIQDLFDNAVAEQKKVWPSVLSDSVSESKMMGSKKERRKDERKKVATLGIEWILKMADQNSSPLLEKMCLFWHGHFACNIKRQKLSYNYLCAIRKNALGNFKDLVLAIAKDPAMLKYLNNKVNKKSSPNENFARELLELFTIGIGNYTETDIKEAARAFTGWTSDYNDDFIVKERNHDFGMKYFMGKRGNFDGEDIIDIVLQNKQTANFICTKVYKYFVNDKVNTEHVESLATIFFESNYNINTLMKSLFSASWFYDSVNFGNKIKSPIELIAGMIHILDINFKTPIALFKLQRILGQQLFNPPNVAGWNGGKSWIDNSTLMLRLNLAKFLFQNSEVPFVIKEDLDGKTFGNKLKSLNATITLNPLIKLIKKVPNSQREKVLTDLVLLDTSKINHTAIGKYIDESNEQSKLTSLIILFMSMPEYQMC